MRLAPLLCLAACSSPLTYNPTYHQDVAPLFVKYCQDCHSDDGIVSYPHLDQYADAKSYAELIAAVVNARRMPEWGAENSGACGTWQDARWLSARELATITEWQQTGAPEGEPDAVTSATSFSPPFRADASLSTGGVYQPGLGDGGDRCFIADPAITQDRLLTAIRVTSDDPRAIAQVTLFALDSADAETEVQALDDGDPGLGYYCFGTARTGDSRLVSSWTWPEPVLPMPAGTGVRLMAGRKMVVQIHYDVSRTGAAFESATTVDLQLDQDNAADEAMVMPISATGPLAPAMVSVTVENSQPAGAHLSVVGIAPRMHIRGKTMYVLVRHGESSRCLGNFEEWSFDSAQLFRAVNPVALAPDDNLVVRCTYNTQGDTDPVPFGDNIDDEECVAYLFVTRS